VLCVCAAMSASSLAFFTATFHAANSNSWAALPPRKLLCFACGSGVMLFGALVGIFLSPCRGQCDLPGDAGWCRLLVLC
jgi:hypothetical protein